MGIVIQTIIPPTGHEFPLGIISYVSCAVSYDGRLPYVYKKWADSPFTA